MIILVVGRWCSGARARGIMSETTFGRVTVAGMLVALVVGCSGAGPGSAVSASSESAGEVTVTPNPVTPNPVTPDPVTPDPATPDPVIPDPVTPDPVTPDPVTPDPVDTEVAWVPPGPGGLSPAETTVDKAARWYEAFGNHDCATIAALGPERDQRQLYAGLGDACRAVREKNDRLWTSAEIALQHVSDPTDCLDLLALRLLRDLVMAHQSAPHANIRIVDSPPGQGCRIDDSSPPPTSVTSTQTSVPRPSAPAG